MYRFFILCMLLPTLAFSQQDRKLEKGLRELIGNFKGDVGVYVRNLKTGRYAGINEDTIFPTPNIAE